MARMPMARSCLRPIAGNADDGPETPEGPAVGQEANDGRIERECSCGPK